VAQPIDGIMNFTYTDPKTGKTAACDATCPLSNDSSIAFQVSTPSILLTH
jgi:hypothetical protein